MLHYFPRFQKESKNTDWIKIITGQEPKTFEEFILENKKSLVK